MLVVAFTRSRGPLAVFFLATAIAELTPAFPGSALWWRAWWAPLAIVRLMLAGWVTISLYRRPGAEGRYLALWAGAIGAGCVMALRWWVPENTFQAVSIARQYACLALCGGSGAVLVAQGECQHTPKSAKGLETRFWALWLLLTFAGSIATKGGLLWLFFPWKGSGTTWQVYGDLVLLAEMLVLCCWLNRRHELDDCEAAQESQQSTAGRPTFEPPERQGAPR
jgi:hypothetical protein